MMHYINIGGNERPIHFGVNAMALYSEMENISMDEMMAKIDKMRLDQMVKLIYAALKEAARKEKDDIEFTVSDVGDWLDDDFSKLTECINIMGKTMPTAKKNNPKGEA